MSIPVYCCVKFETPTILNTFFIIILGIMYGKALSGGVFPVSAVLASDEVMLNIRPGEHGSTYGGNPVACKVATAALEVLRDEKLSENATLRGEQLRSGIKSFMDGTSIADVRGRGLLNAIVIDDQKGSYNDYGKAWVSQIFNSEKKIIFPLALHVLKFFCVISNFQGCMLDDERKWPACETYTWKYN